MQNEINALALAAVWIGMLAAMLGLAFLCRCVIGWHPRGSVRMRPGRRRKGESVADWHCLRCGRPVQQSRQKLDLRLLSDLRKQVGFSRARSRLRLVRDMDGRMEQ